MALNAYLTLKGQKQGTIKGSVIQKGREGMIEVRAFTHGITSPRDAASGLPTGRRQHSTLTITKPIDRSTPLLFNAIVQNETLTAFELRFFAPNKLGTAGGGSETNHFTIKLTNASVASIRNTMPNNLVADTASLPQTEEVSFTYQKIEMVWTDGGVTATDDWQAGA